MPNDTPAPLLAYRGAGVRFGDRWAVRGIELAVRRGTLVTIVGPSGCGKSTLLRAAAGLLTPDEGEVASGATRLGYMAQQDALFPWQPVTENVAAPLRYRRVARGTRAARVAELLDRVHYPKDARHLYPAQLSGGMRQRASLAQVLASEPELLLLDEPFAALDAQTREALQVELQDVLAATKVTAVLVTHDLIEAITLADEVVLMGAGPAASIKTSYTIELPRPRRVGEVVATSEFAAIYRNLHRELADEVTRAPD
jgi:NitT/TauT family transport system ATP-binding protein